MKTMDAWFTAPYLNVGVHQNEAKGVKTLSFINPHNLKLFIVITDIKKDDLFEDDEVELYLNICREIARARSLSDVGKDIVIIFYDNDFGWTSVVNTFSVFEKVHFSKELQDLTSKLVKVKPGHWGLESINLIK